VTILKENHRRNKLIKNFSEVVAQKYCIREHLFARLALRQNLQWRNVQICKLGFLIVNTTLFDENMSETNQ